MKKQKWILKRDSRVTNIFNSRQEAIKYFIKLLNQTLNDFKNQDKNNNFDYSIHIAQIDIIPVDERQHYLGL